MQSTKNLKFNSKLVPLILSGRKTSTWRLFDDKNLSEGDRITLKEFGAEDGFAKAVVKKVVVKRFDELTKDDRSGHESYASDDEMYKTYSDYYKTPVGPKTTVKIIWFELY